MRLRHGATGCRFCSRFFKQCPENHVLLFESISLLFEAMSRFAKPCAETMSGQNLVTPLPPLCHPFVNPAFLSVYFRRFSIVVARKGVWGRDWECPQLRLRHKATGCLPQPQCMPRRLGLPDSPARWCCRGRALVCCHMWELQFCSPTSTALGTDRSAEPGMPGVSVYIGLAPLWSVGLLLRCVHRRSTRVSCFAEKSVRRIVLLICWDSFAETRLKCERIGVESEHATEADSSTLGQ